MALESSHLSSPPTWSTGENIELDRSRSQTVACGGMSTSTAHRYEAETMHQPSTPISMEKMSQLAHEGPQTENQKDTPEESQAPYCVLPEWEKIFIMLCASFAAIISPISSSIYFPAVNTLSNDMHVSVGLINLTVTTYLVKCTKSFP